MDIDQTFRLMMVAIFVISASISKYHRRKAKLSGEAISRRDEGGVAMLLRAAVALPLMLSFLAYMINPSWMAWSKLALPVWARWVGVGLGIACLPLLWTLFQSIGSNISETVLTKKNHSLIMTGPFRWIRHPLYTVAMLLFFSYGLMASNWWMMMFTALGLGLIVVLVIPKEEAELIAKFGDEYRDYQERVGKLLPRLSSLR
jgi:protein-S-isoprenylcysteine O-methyltransferase Ste14